MATIKRSKLKSGRTRYRVRIRIKGVYQSRTFTAKAEAEHWGADTEREIYRAGMSPHELAKERTLWALIDKYCDEVLPHKAMSSQRVQHRQLMFWKDFLGDCRLIEVTPPLISAGKQALSARSPGTINGYLSCLSHVFTVAVKEWYWAESNPVSKVYRLPELKGRCRFLSVQERKTLLVFAVMSSNRYLHSIMVVALSTGARKNEVRGLRWSQVDVVKGVAYLETTKNKEPRTLRLFGEALEAMRGLHADRQLGSRYCFPSKDGLRPVDFRYAWENVRIKAKIENFCFHDLRHSTASYLAMNGASLNDIGEILGHKALKSSKRYTHLTEGHTAQVQEKMNRAIF